MEVFALDADRDLRALVVGRFVEQLIRAAPEQLDAMIRQRHRALAKGAEILAALRSHS